MFSFSQYSLFVEAVLLAPMSEAVVERGFSKMKLTLNDKRKR